MTLIYVTDGPWGAGKGSPATAAEIDGNFHQLDLRIVTLEENPPQAVSIQSIEVNGNQMTITLTNGTTQGPFALPIAQITFGSWAPNQFYKENTILTQGGALYWVLHDHTSDATFDPGRFDPDIGFIYSLVLTRPAQPYDIGLAYPQPIPGDDSVLLEHVACRTINLPGDLRGSVAYLRVPPSDSDLSFPIMHDGTQIGTIDFPLGQQFGTFNMGGPADTWIVVLSTERIAIQAPGVTDNSAASLSVTLAGEA